MYKIYRGAQWLSGRVLDSRPRGSGFEPHRRHCLVSLSKIVNPSLALVQPKKTRPFITERLLMGRKESNQTKKKTQQDLWMLKSNFKGYFNPWTCRFQCLNCKITDKKAVRDTLFP